MEWLLSIVGFTEKKKLEKCLEFISSSFNGESRCWIHIQRLWEDRHTMTTLLTFKYGWIMKEELQKYFEFVSSGYYEVSKFLDSHPTIMKRQSH